MLLNKLCFATILTLTSASLLSLTPKQTECCEEYCYEEDVTRPQYQYQGSRSGYPFTRGTDNQIYNVPGCSGEKIWMLVRHGTRLPSAQSMAQLVNLEKIRDDIVHLYSDTNPGSNLPERGRLCDADLNLIANWKWDTNNTAEYDEFLTLSGWNEMKDLATDYRNAFPNVIGNAYSPERFRFSHTEFQRTEGSYQAFVEGLFGDGAYNDFAIDLLPNPNMVMSPMYFCDAYDENIIAQNGPDSETAKFRNSEIYRKLRSDVSTKIGYLEPAFQTLSDANISNIYEMCRFEKAWDVEKSSPWCSVLTPSQFKILAYHDDLDIYMKQSYGSPVNSKLFCSGMDEMLNHLSTDASPTVVAYFAHFYFIISHLTAMGAFKDATPLRGDNFDEMENRTFKTSQLVPFSANFAAVKYNCPNDVGAEVKVKFFLNQKTLNFDWCDDNGVCELSDVLEQYSLFRNGDCEEIFCSTADNSGDRLGKLFFVLFFSLAMVTVILK